MKTKGYTYFVKGMNCASCEILIEKELLEMDSVHFADASIRTEEVVINYEGERPSCSELNKIFRKKGYIFSDEPLKTDQKLKEKDFSVIFGFAVVIIAIFLNLNRFGLEGLVNVGAGSSLPVFFLLGVLAGLSSCAALVGGLLLSVSKQWKEIYSETDSFLQKAQPYIMFNVGRIIFFGVFGYFLGIIGTKLQLSIGFTSVLIFIVSLIMIVLGLQMLGVKYFKKFQFVLPKFVTANITDEKKFKGKYMPFGMGALTFFFPCGFTITAQGLALISGNPLQSAMIMFVFALGTAPSLILIGFSSIKFLDKPHLAKNFSRFAAILILFFAIYNINSQLNVMGLPSLSSTRLLLSQSYTQEEFVPIVNGKQIIKMDALPFGYTPNYFKVKVGVPTRLEIADRGTSGCTNALIARRLFDEEILLTPGQISVKEFIPQIPGRYRFSCWMGMISGIIEVVE